MCLILLALRAHADYPLIVAANRDEFFNRPTRFAEFWPEHPELLAGRDLLAGGSWLGINRRGQFAAVTNVRNGLDTQARSKTRGELVTDCLLSQEPLTANSEVLRRIAAQHDLYSGFNLLAGNPHHLLYTSNRAQDLLTSQSTLHPTPAAYDKSHATRELPSGLYGLSNGGLDTPWPKVTSGKAMLADILQRDWQQLEARQEDLLTLLADDTQAAAELLPDTGVGAEKEALLSSRFIATVADDPDQDPSLGAYGTRASTVVLFHRSGRIHFLEKSFGPQPPQELSAAPLTRPALEVRGFVI